MQTFNISKKGQTFLAKNLNATSLNMLLTSGRADEVDQVAPMAIQLSFSIIT